MKKLSIVFLMVIMALLFFYTVQEPVEVEARIGLFGGARGLYSTKTVMDSTSLTTWTSVVDYAGEGFIYRIIFNNDSSHDAFIRITVDGYVDSFTVANDEERAYYIMRSNDMNTIGAYGNNKGTMFAIGDSTSAAIGNLDLNLEFTSQFKVEARSEASGQTNTLVIWGEEQ